MAATKKVGSLSALPGLSVVPSCSSLPTKLSFIHLKLLAESQTRAHCGHSKIEALTQKDFVSWTAFMRAILPVVIGGTQSTYPQYEVHSIIPWS